MLHIFFYIITGLLVLLGLFVLGLILRPRPFRPHPAPTKLGEPAPVRPDLPPMVHKHFVETIGETPPRIESAVVWGRGQVCIRGVWAPTRFKAWYQPGVAFKRRMEVTWFLRPVMRGRESWREGRGVFAMGEKYEDGPGVDQGELLTLWAETVWLPSVFVHNPLLRWESVDKNSARLIIPAGVLAADNLLAHFDPLNGRMTHFSSLRYSTDSDTKEPWRMDLLTWKRFHGLMIPDQVSVAWGESGSPWSYWTVDGVAYNVKVDDQLGSL